MIVCEQLEFGIGRRPILRDCSFAVPRGAHVLLTGPSGGGKTTLLRLIAGLETPSRGTIRLGDRTVAADGHSLVPAFRRGLGLMFQDLGLWPALSVGQHLESVLDRSELTADQRREQIEFVANSCRLTGLESRRPGQLSGGEQQRLALARCLVARPRWLLLDEPFAGLDVILRSELSGLVRDLRRRWELTIVTVSHQPEDVLGLEADLLAVVEEGRVVETIKPCQLQRVLPRSRTCVAWKNLLAPTTYGIAEYRRQ